jgi:hypothetical protein
MFQDMVHQSAEHGTTTDSLSLRYLQQLIPLAYPPSILPDPATITVGPPPGCASTCGGVNGPCPMDVEGCKPLDLSGKPDASPTAMTNIDPDGSTMGVKPALVPLKVPQIHNKSGYVHIVTV